MYKKQRCLQAFWFKKKILKHNLPKAVCILKQYYITNATTFIVFTFSFKRKLALVS